MTDEKPTGNVNITNANVTITGHQIEIHPTTFIFGSNVTINGSE